MAFSVQDMHKFSKISLPWEWGHPLPHLPPLGRITSSFWPRWQILATPLSLALLMVHKAHAPTPVDWRKKKKKGGCWGGLV